MTNAQGMSRSLFAPEVIQTSAIDCGPAALKCMLEGFGITVSYGRLREACQTDVDGTSIDTLEEVAAQLGLQVQQIMVPVDHVLLPEAQILPAIAITYQSDGSPHFVVAWRRYGHFMQLMDPATGRRWPTCQQFLKQLYVHTLPLPATVWREWAGSDDALGLLRRRMQLLRVPSADQEEMIKIALENPSWMSLGNLDAAIRMIGSIVQAGGLRRGKQATRSLATVLERTCKEGPNASTGLPASYWSVQPVPPNDEGEEQIYFRGAVLLRASVCSPVEVAALADEGQSRSWPSTTLSPELTAALQEPPSRPGRTLLRLLKDDGLLAPATFFGALLLATAGIMIEGILFRSFLDLERDLGLSGQRLGAMVMLLIFILILFLLEWLINTGLLRSGRHLETRLRIAFLAKLPKLGDRYFRSRPASDMAERSHSLYRLRILPTVGGQLIRATLELALTATGIIWLDPASAPLAILSALLVVALPLAAQPLLSECNLRVRSHGGALSRFYLDSLLGLIALRTHAAERAVCYEHRILLGEWFHASLKLQRATIAVEGVQFLMGFGCIAWLLLAYQARGGEASVVLLLVYWALNLPVLGQEIALLAQQYPTHRSTALRLLDPLGALEETSENTTSDTASLIAPETAVRGVRIMMEGVEIRAAGNMILEDVNLEIEPGSHVAIVGASGAGKSSLVGALLGWHRPTTGCIRIDGVPLDGTRLERLRQNTVWVDPAVQLWNRSFLDNLRYGALTNSALQINEVLDQSDLREVLERLPDGLQTPLGEGGTLVSGGEGQRVRFGRALLRSDARLVILDEPFRGLDREQRRTLLYRARKLWRHLTMLSITHDVSDTLGFDRVLVIDAGHVVEDGVPTELADQPSSHYRALLEAEDAVRKGLWSHHTWRRLQLRNGHLVEDIDGKTR